MTATSSAQPASSPGPGRLGSIQIHIDPTWAIAKTFGGDLPAEDFVYRKTVPILLELLAEQNLKTTFFIIGNDLKIKGNAEVAGRIVREGHEIGNHSLSHPIGFRHLDRKEKEKEIVTAEKLIEDTVGVRPRGFSAPAYDIDEVALSILEDRGYAYDTSVYPSYFSIGAKIYRHLKTKLSGRGVAPSVKPSSWGKITCVFAPRSPYFPARGNLLRKKNSGILEIPLSTIPFLGMPFYNYFCLFAGKWYFRTGLRMLRMTKRPLNYLIHPTELFDPEDVAAGKKYMISSRTANLSSSRKIIFLKSVLRELKSHYRIIRLREFADTVARRNGG